VDHPATQAWKRRRLEEAAIGIPDTLAFVPVNFEQQDLAVELARAGLDADRPAFFAWLGVTPYLHLPALMATLGTIARAARGGGGVVFDYGVKPSVLSLKQRMIFEAMSARVRAAGEPWITFFDPNQLVHDLHALGFDRVEDSGPDELNPRYFADRTDGLHIGGVGRIMTALSTSG
jgi:methyltransferase (TIGR00027 family)